MMEAMKKTITINNRALVRSYRLYREKLLNGEVDRVVIPVNGKKLYLAVLPEKPTHRPGDIRPLLEQLKRMGPKKRISTVRPEWSMKNFMLMEKLWGKKRRKKN